MRTIVILVMLVVASIGVSQTLDGPPVLPTEPLMVIANREVVRLNVVEDTITVYVHGGYTNGVERRSAMVVDAYDGREVTAVWEPLASYAGELSSILGVPVTKNNLKIALRNLFISRLGTNELIAVMR